MEEEIEEEDEDKDLFLKTKGEKAKEEEGKFIDDRGVIDLNTLAEELEEDPKFIKHTLDVWVLSWCSFFEYGRVGYDSTQGKLFYIKNTHPQARFHRPRVKFSLE